MKRALLTKCILVLLALAALQGFSTTGAKAQNPQTFVSPFGNDTDFCTTPATACFSFGGAHGKTLDGGTITCLSPAYYGILTITKSITIDCLAGGGGENAQGITINAPGGTVRLQNLSVNGIGTSLHVQISAANTVQLSNVRVAGSTGPAILDQRTGPGRLIITDSFVENNGGPGILVVPASGLIGVVLDNVHSSHNTYGLAVANGGRVMVSRSVFSWNASAGIEADGGAIVSVDGTQVSFNSVGLQNGGTMQVSNSGILSNSTAVSGTVQSYGNNRVFANSSDGTPLTSVGGLSSENGQR